MLSNATSIAWIMIAWGKQDWTSQPQRNGRLSRSRRGPNRERDKGETNEDQTDQPIRGRPEQGPALLYRGTGLCQEGRFQQRPVPLVDRSLARGAGRN